jgi:hypothetical protein
MRCDIGAVEVQVGDTDTVQKCSLSEGSSYSFGPTFFELLVNTGGSLDCVTVQIVPGDAPGAPAEIANSSDQYWNISATGSGYNLDVDFPTDTIAGTPQYLCSSEGSGWTCTLDSNPDGSLLGGQGITSFSTWQGCGGAGCESPTAITLTGLEAKSPGSFTWAAILAFLGVAALLAFLRRRMQNDADQRSREASR